MSGAPRHADLPTDLTRRVVAKLPAVSRSVVHTTSFHVVKLPALEAGVDRLGTVTAEFVIQPLGKAGNQAVWWTSYVLVARPGLLAKESGVYDEWKQFATVSVAYVGLVSPVNQGFVIVDEAKGVLNGSGSTGVPYNGTVHRRVDLSQTSKGLEIYVVLVAAAMHDGAYQVNGQATLQYKLQSQDDSNW